MVSAIGLFLTTALVFCIISVAPLLRRLFAKKSIDEITPEWLEMFSPERYRPMASLLSEEDFAFLSRQPGFDRRLAKKLRRERLVIFRGYLHCLISDFNRLHAAARFLVARSSEDRSDLALQLMSLQWRFNLNVLKVHFQLLLCRFVSGTIQVATLVQTLEAMSAQLVSLGTPQSAAARPLAQLV